MKKITINELKYIIEKSISMIFENSKNEDFMRFQVIPDEHNKEGYPKKFIAYYGQNDNYVETNYEGNVLIWELSDEDKKLNDIYTQLCNYYNKNNLRENGVKILLRYFLNKSAISVFRNLNKMDTEHFHLFNIFKKITNKDDFGTIQDLVNLSKKVDDGIISLNDNVDTTSSDAKSFSYPINGIRKKDGKYNLQYDVFNTNNASYHGFLAKSKVEYFNISHFSQDVAQLLKHNLTGKGSGFYGRFPVSYGKVNSKYGKIDFNHSEEMQGYISDIYKGKYKGKTLDNPELSNVNLSLKSNGGKRPSIINKSERKPLDAETIKGTTFMDGETLIRNSAIGTAYIIDKKYDVSKNNIPLMILSIQSSSNFNSNFIGDNNNQNSVIWSLKNDFGYNGEIISRPYFFKKTPERIRYNDNAGENTVQYLEMVILCSKIKNIYKNADKEDIEKYIKYINEKVTNEELIDYIDNSSLRGLNEVLFTNLEYKKKDDEDRYQIGQGNNTKDGSLRYSKYRLDYNLPINDIIISNMKAKSYVYKIFSYYENPDDKDLPKRTMFNTFKSHSKFEIKKVNREDRNKISDFISIGDIEEVNLILSEGGKIIVIDDNYSTGATLDESCFELISKVNGIKDNMIAITPGYMVAKIDASKNNNKIK